MLVRYYYVYREKESMFPSFSPPFTWRNGRGLGDVTGWAGLSRLIVKKRIVAVVVVVVV